MANTMRSVWHLVAILLGIVGAIFVVLAVMLFYGYTTPAAIDGITQADTELYAALAIVGAVGSEIASRESK